MNAHPESLMDNNWYEFNRQFKEGDFSEEELLRLMAYELANKRRRQFYIRLHQRYAAAVKERLLVERYNVLRELS